METLSTRRAVLYARLSVTTEESVSIERQMESARQYARARGWKVVLEAIDDGVSATKNKPEDRPGWRSVIDFPEPYEAVIVWKIDRLARRVLDFLHADETLRDRGAGIVAVEDPVDMTTAQGRAFATMLAVFGEMEAAAMGARATAARKAILHAGRRAGGRVPYGWKNVRSETGAGVVLQKDPETIGVVEGIVVRALNGDSYNAIADGLNKAGIGAPGRAGSSSQWTPSGIETVLRLPAIGGLTAYRGDVIRDPEGLPVVDDSIALLSPADRRALLQQLDSRKRPRAGTPRAEPALLSGLVRCGRCGQPLYRAAAASGRYTFYRCARKACLGSVGGSRPRIEEAVVGEFLRVAGPLPVRTAVEVGGQDPGPRLAEIEAAVTDTLARMGEDGADVAALAERLASLKSLRSEARTLEVEAPELVEVLTGETFGEAWSREEGSVPGQAALLALALTGVYVEPTDRRGNTFDPARLVYRWRGSAESIAEGLED